MALSQAKHIRVFQKLMDEVVDKCSIDRLFVDFKHADFIELSENIGLFHGYEDGDSPVKVTTLKDYKSIYLEAKVFSVMIAKLNFLCQYIEKGHWSKYLLSCGVSDEQENSSFYKIQQPYELIYAQREGLEAHILRNERRLKELPLSTETLFNQGVVLMYFAQYEASLELLYRGCLLEPRNSSFHQFIALALLGKTRPFQHKKHVIDEILINIKRAQTLDPSRNDTCYLTNLIYNDFHKRIGYSYDIEDKCLVTKQPTKELVWIFSRCASIEESELKHLLL